MIQNKRYSESDINRVREFVNHLFSNPAIKSEPPLVGERLIINFIAKNSRELNATFKNPQFFPVLEWNEVLGLIFNDIYNRLYASELQHVNNFIDNSDLSFFDRLSDGGVVADAHRKTRLHEFVKTLFGDREVRYRINPVIEILRYNAVDRYAGAIFRRRDYIHNELVRVQKINLEATDYISLIKTVLLVRSVIHYKLTVNRNGIPSTITLSDEPGNKKNIGSYIESALSALTPMLPGIPSRIIKLAIKSNFAVDMLEDDEALPKFVYILCSMFQNYRHIEKPDRGAETQEKSWLGVAKKNYSHAGFDRRMIESLYLIAGDNNW